MKSTKSQPASRITPVQACDPEALQWDMQEMQFAIARRAYELFEARNCEHGHDREDWFQAEAELLCPVSIAISETADGLSLRANVADFSAKELKIGVKPQRIAIVGRKEVSAASATEEASPADAHPDQILRLIDLPSEIDPAGAVVELRSGVLRFELPKLAKAQASAAGAA
jgi:HSP20 family molecular chaperone IbpA